MGKKMKKGTELEEMLRRLENHDFREVLESRHLDSTDLAIYNSYKIFFEEYFRNFGKVSSVSRQL